MDKDNLIRLKYRLESIRDREYDYKSNKYYSIINPSNIIYTGNSIISLYRLERDIDNNKFMNIFESVQEEFIRDSINNNIIFDEMRIKIYNLLLVDKLELDMIKRDYDMDNRRYNIVPKKIEFLNDICIIGRVNYELYKDNEKVYDKRMDDNYYIVKYSDLKDKLYYLGYDDFNIDNFNDLVDSVYDNRKCVEEVSVKFRKNIIKVK